METKPKHILVVDDFKVSASLVQQILENAGYSTHIEYAGIDGIEYLQNTNVDLIMLDIVLPGIDGYEVCKQIRRQVKYDDIPIVFMTSKDDEESIDRGFRLGGQDYIKKPFFHQELLARVKTQLTVKSQKEELEKINKKLEQRVIEKNTKLDNAFIELQKAYKEIEASKKKLEVLDKAKLNFLSIISHEIRTPLNSILGFSELLKDFEGSEEYTESVNFLLSSAKRLEEFSQNAILISELVLGKYQFCYSNINLHDFISRIIKQLKDLYLMKMPELNMNFSNKLNVYADNYLLEVCFVNILANAFRYVKQKGQIEISGWDEHSDIVIQITDEGKHFTKEILDDPFTLFTKGEEFVNKNPGNGLAIIKYVMDSHSGRVELFNISKGACIKLYFPHYLNNREA